MTRALAATRRLLPALFLVALACGDDPLSPEAAVSGTYALTSANGKKPPTTVFSQDQKGVRLDIDITGGQLVLRDGDYDSRLDIDARLNGQPFPGGNQPVTASGTYTVSGASITLETEDGTRVTGTIADRTITLSETEDLGGQNVTITLVFTR